MRRLAVFSTLLVATACLLFGCSDPPDDNDNDDNQNNDDPAVYTVTATAGDGGSISPDEVEVQEGETAEFTVDPDADYEIQSVTGCDGELDDTTFSTAPVQQDCTVEAEFIPMALETHTVTATAGDGGSISPGEIMVEDGQTTEFSVDPDDGFEIDEVTGCDGSLDDTTYTTGPITEECTVEATFEQDEPTPTVDWTFDPDAEVKGVTLYDDELFVTTLDGEIFALDPETGDDNWDFETDTGFTDRPAVDDDRVYAATTDGEIYAVDRTTGSEDWTYDAEQMIHGSVAVDGVNAYALTSTGELHAARIDDGDDNWDHEFDDQSSVMTSPVAHDFEVFAAVEGETSAISDSGPVDPWERDIGREDVSPAVGDDLVFTANDDELHALQTSDGTDEWDEALDETPFGAVAWADPEDTDSMVVVPGLEGSLFAFDATDGDSQWTFNPDDTQFTNDPTVGDDGLVFATYTVPDDHQDVNYDVEETGLMAVDDGELAWTHTVDTETDETAPATDGDLVFFGTADGGDGTVYGLERP